MKKAEKKMIMTGIKFFLCGVGVTTSIIGIFQDVIGQQAVINMAKNHWVTSWFSAPFLSVCLILFSFELLRLFRYLKRIGQWADERVNNEVHH